MEAGLLSKLWNLEVLTNKLGVLHCNCMETFRVWDPVKAWISGSRLCKSYLELLPCRSWVGFKKLWNEAGRLQKPDGQRWLYFRGQLTQSEKFYLGLPNKFHECYVSLTRSSYSYCLLHSPVNQRRWYLTSGSDRFKKCVFIWGKPYLWFVRKYGMCWLTWDCVKAGRRDWDCSAVRSARIQMKHQKVSEVHPLLVSVNFNACLKWLFPRECGCG